MVSRGKFEFVVPRPDPGIHNFAELKNTWMAGTKPGHDEKWGMRFRSPSQEPCPSKIVDFRAQLRAARNLSCKIGVPVSALDARRGTSFALVGFSIFGRAQTRP
jgi:hypothetical protein